MASPIASINTLPPELISHIFSFLDGPAPSDVRLRDQPSPTMLASPDAPLKLVSLVSKRWRAIILPVLFRHILWAFDRWDLVFPGASGSNTGASSDAAGNPTTLPLIAFIRANSLGRCVESLTLIVSDRMYGQYRLAEAANAAGSGRRSDYTSKEGDDLDEDVMSVLSKARSMDGWTSRWRQHSARSEDSNWLWEILFEAMDPKRFTVIALPRMLASLLSRMLFLGDAWSFRDQCHILSLDRRTPESLERWNPDKPRERSEGGSADGDEEPQASSPEESTSAPESSASASSSSKQPAQSSRHCGDAGKAVKTILFTIRPWTSILLNEGSSTRVYKTYEFFLKRPPSILGSLLGCEESPNNVPLIPPSVRSFSYIAIFPLSAHFNSLVSHLPRVDNLYLQLVPRNDILDNKEEMAHIQTGDLWMERNTCYSLVMRKLCGNVVDIGFGFDHHDDDDDAELDNGWSGLRVFESGDAADKEAWDMAVAYVRMSGTSWAAVADGVLVNGGPRPERPEAAHAEAAHPDAESPPGSPDPVSDVGHGGEDASAESDSDVSPGPFSEPYDEF